MNWGRLTWELIRPYGRYVYYELRPHRRPAYFHEPWKYPTHPVQAQKPGGRRPDPNRPTVIFFPMNDWHARVQRSQQLAKAFAELGHRCIYVNPHLGLEYKAPYAFDPRSMVSLLPGGIEEVHIHLPREHHCSSRFMTASEVRRVLDTVQTLLGDAEAPAILIVSLPVWREVAVALRAERGFPLLYDCHDLLEGFERMPKELPAAEGELFRSADMVSFSSQYLLDTMCRRMPSLKGKSTLIRNAVDPRDFQVAPHESQHGGAPVIGYVGALDHWFDIESVAAAARAHADWKFELVGRVEDPRILALNALPNIHFAGEAPYSEVPRILAGWSAAMIPFLRTPLTMATNPIKLYEYLSAGLPVASTRLPEVERFGDHVHVADSPREFADAVALAVHGDGSRQAAARKQMVASETWQHRASALLSVVAEVTPVSSVSSAL